MAVATEVIAEVPAEVPAEMPALADDEGEAPAVLAAMPALADDEGEAPAVSAALDAHVAPLPDDHPLAMFVCRDSLGMRDVGADQYSFDGSAIGQIKWY
jgi:hypothetical protein